MEKDPEVPQNYITGFKNPESTVVKLTEMTDSSFVASVFDQKKAELSLYSISQKPNGTIVPSQMKKIQKGKFYFFLIFSVCIWLL